MRMENTNDVPQKSNKTGINVLQDTAWVITLLTALCYFFSFSFQKGVSSYYGTDKIELSELNIPSMVDSVYEVSSLVLKICLLYILSRLIVQYILFLDKWRESNKKDLDENGKEFHENNLSKFSEFMDKFIDPNFLYKLESKDTPITRWIDQRLSTRVDFSHSLTNSIFINFVIVSIPILIFADPKNVFIVMIILSIAMLSFLILILLLLFLAVLTMTKITRLFIFREGFFLFFMIFIIILNEKNPLSYIWKKCNLGLRVIIILTVGIGLSSIFYQYGYTKSEKETNYKVVQFLGEDFVLLDKDGNRMLVSPLRKLDNKDTISKEEFKFIELKQKNINSLIIKDQNLEDGLIVVPNKEGWETKVRRIIGKVLDWVML